MADDGAMGLVSGLAKNTGGLMQRKRVKDAVSGYEQYHERHGGDEKKRKLNYADMVNKYYDLATSFYEYGWGQSFHFAHRWRQESLQESIKRHEHFLALHLNLRPGMKVLDVGCGIGGPLREIARFSGASVTGLNNNQYQITRGQTLNARVGLADKCDFIKADFMNIPLPDNSFDAIYAIEATCHAPDSVACYREIWRVLKPGQLFAGYEWCMTARYNAENPAHRQLKADIELGNGLPTLQTVAECLAALKAAGFEIVLEEDIALSSDVPWYLPLDPNNISLQTLKLTRWGRFFTRNLVWWLETFRIAPEGSCRVQEFLEKGADGLVAGGKLGTFTPMYFFVARKPLTSATPTASLR